MSEFDVIVGGRSASSAESGLDDDIYTDIATDYSTFEKRPVDENSPHEPHGGGHHRRPKFKGQGMRIRLSYIHGVTHKKLRKDLPFYFQAPPLDSFAPSYAHAHGDYDTIEGVQYSRRGSKQLATVSFSTVNVIENHPWVIHHAHWRWGPVTRMFKEIVDRGYPLRLVTWDRGQRTPELDMPVTLRSFVPTEKANEPDARYYDLDFVQWRDSASSRRKRNGGGHHDWPVKHKLIHKDTLRNLARHYYHRSHGARQIGVHNPGLKNWGRDKKIVEHHRYKPGDTIIIPNPPKRFDHHDGNGNGSHPERLPGYADWTEYQ